MSSNLASNTDADFNCTYSNSVALLQSLRIVIVVVHRHIKAVLMARAAHRHTRAALQTKADPHPTAEALRHLLRRAVVAEAIKTERDLASHLEILQNPPRNPGKNSR